MKQILFCFLGILLLMPSTLFAEKVYLRCTHDVHLQNVKATRPVIQWDNTKFDHTNLCEQRRTEVAMRSNGKIDVWSDEWTASNCTTQNIKDIYVDEAEKVFAIKENGNWKEYKSKAANRDCKTVKVDGDNVGWCSLESTYVNFSENEIKFNKGNFYQPEVCPFPMQGNFEEYSEERQSFLVQYCLGSSFNYDFSGNRLILTLNRSTSEVEHYLSIKSASLNSDGNLDYKHVRGSGFNTDDIITKAYKKEFGTCKVLKRQF
tara:strand:- start:744 stop:1526 length:783 start_codon:yes stop_codon:yes gene_type:complete